MSPELHFEPSLVLWRRVDGATTRSDRGGDMVLATAKIGDFDRFWNTFSTKGAEKRKQHGCKGAHVFRDPNESDRVWAIFDWDEAGWQSFTSDPEVPAIFQEAGFTQGPPKSAEFLRQHDA
jgi:quinol monooxygenase YgiN